MAYHFSANQFEDHYDPKKLGNWEYPKWFPERPRQRFNTTKIIVNDNGYIRDGIKKTNPWGNYLGTWDLPKRITREFAEKLAAPPERLASRWQKKSETSVKEKTKSIEEEQSVQEGNVVCPEQDSPSESSSEEEMKGEPVTCTKCNNAVCLCDNEVCTCANP